VAKYKLTVRTGPRVDRQTFDDLDEAIAALEERAKEVRTQGPLPERSFVRDFNPGDQVAGRVERSTSGLLRRGLAAGIDVMGDGRYVAFRGGFAREVIDYGGGSPFKAVRKVFAR
jgi:hypothetical protein